MNIALPILLLVVTLLHTFLFLCYRYLTVVLGVFALDYLEISFTETVKSTAPAFTVIIARVLLGKCFSINVTGKAHGSVLCLWCVCMILSKISIFFIYTRWNNGYIRKVVADSCDGRACSLFSKRVELSPHWILCGTRYKYNWMVSTGLSYLRQNSLGDNHRTI